MRHDGLHPPRRANGADLPLRSVARLAGSAIALGLLGTACSHSDAPDDLLGAIEAPRVAEVVPAEQALAGAFLPAVDPMSMADAEVRKHLGDTAHCTFRYTRTGKPVLAFGLTPQGGSVGGLVKLNGHLVPISTQATEAGPTAVAPASGVPAGSLQLGAGAVRIVVTPLPRGKRLSVDDAALRETTVILEVGEELSAGYRGYLNCTGAKMATASR